MLAGKVRCGVDCAFIDRSRPGFKGNGGRGEEGKRGRGRGEGEGRGNSYDTRAGGRRALHVRVYEMDWTGQDS